MSITCQAHESHGVHPRCLGAFLSQQPKGILTYPESRLTSIIKPQTTHCSSLLHSYLIYPIVIAFSSGAGTFRPPSHCGVACILLLSFVRIANLCVRTQLVGRVGSSNATYHYVSNQSHRQGLLDFPCATKSKIGTRLQWAGKLITLCCQWRTS
jgi:hypothetical protein